MPDATIDSEAFIEGPRSTILCDGSLVDNIIDEFGTYIILRVVTKHISSDEYAENNPTYSDHRILAMVDRWSAQDEEVKEGSFKAGEVSFSFKRSEEGYIVTGNRILYQGKWYEIASIVKQPMGDVLYYLTCRVRKV